VCVWLWTHKWTVVHFMGGLQASGMAWAVTAMHEVDMTYCCVLGMGNPLKYSSLHREFSWLSSV